MRNSVSHVESAYRSVWTVVCIPDLNFTTWLDDLLSEVLPVVTTELWHRRAVPSAKTQKRF